MPKQSRRIVLGCIAIFFSVTWLLLAGYMVGDIRQDFRQARATEAVSINPYEYSRWITAHDQSKTAVLVRDYSLDLNFRLFIVDRYAPQIPTDVTQALWSSRDYEPTTYRTWQEDIEWSGDSSVVAVTLEGAYVFAYDFSTGQKVEDPDNIQKLLEEHKLPPTPQD